MSKSNHKGGTYDVTSYQYGGSTYGIKTCNHPPKPVKVGDIEIYGCAQRDVDLAVKQGFDVISPLVQSCNSEFAGFYGLLLWFPIADMTAPEPLRLRIHATRLIELARAGNRVVTFCIGSHGRTGTVLATCIGLLEPDVDPIDAVRERHCKESVETYKQIEAVFLACGREVPERWKESSQYKKYQPAWVQQGLSWNPASKDVTNDIVPGSTNTGYCCEVCNEPGGVGIDQLHWFGPIRAHLDCYERIEKQAKEKEKTTVASSKTPSADSPPATSNVQQTALSIGGYHHESYTSKDAEPDTDTGETTPTLMGVGADQRPFFAKWSEKQKRKYKFVTNEKDQFGDLKCPSCKYLITDPYAAQKFDNKAVHMNCKKAQSFIDCVPLCVICDDAYVDPPNEYCVDCQDALDSNAEFAETLVDIEKETNVADNSLSQDPNAEKDQI